MKSKPIKIKVAHYDGMVNIDTPTRDKDNDFGYANIAKMYKGGLDGVGLQVNNEDNREAILKMCNKISDAVYEYKQTLEKGE